MRCAKGDLLRSVDNHSILFRYPNGCFIVLVAKGRRGGKKESLREKLVLTDLVDANGEQEDGGNVLVSGNFDAVGIAHVKSLLVDFGDLKKPMRRRHCSCRSTYLVAVLLDGEGATDDVASDAEVTQLRRCQFVGIVENRWTVLEGADGFLRSSIVQVPPRPRARSRFSSDGRRATLLLVEVAEFVLELVERLASFEQTELLSHAEQVVLDGVSVGAVLGG